MAKKMELLEKARKLTQKNADAQLLKDTENLLEEIRAKIKKSKKPKEKEDLKSLREKLEMVRKDVRRRLGLSLNDKRSAKSQKRARKPRAK